MRILLQCPYYAPEVGGLESHVRDLSEALARRGHEVTMLTGASQPGLAKSETIGGVEVRRVWMPSRTPAGWMTHIAATVPVHRRLGRRADLYHAHTFACVLPPMLNRTSRRRPLVVTLHTSHFLMRAQKPAWRPILRRLIREADYLLATSEEIRDVAVALYPHSHAEAITNPVDTDRFSPREGSSVGGRHRLIVPRRLFPKNGVEYFVRALPILTRELDVEALIVGDGPERGRLTALAVELGVEERIQFLGARAHEEMPDLLRSADLAVIPSLMEATSIAALEAMSCGLPVAASSVGGLPEIIDDRVGTLFQAGDPDAMARSIVTLLKRSDLGELGSEARRRVVRSWSLERMVDRHVEIYEELLEEGHPGED